MRSAQVDGEAAVYARQGAVRLGMTAAAVALLAVCAGCDRTSASDLSQADSASAPANGREGEKTQPRAAGAPQSAARPRAPIQFDQTVLSLGHVPPGTHVSRSIMVTNLSDLRLTVGAIRTNCGCTKATVASTSIDSRGQTALQIDFDSDWVFGRKDTVIQVEIQGYEPVRVTMHSNISLAVWAEPAVIVSQLPNQQSAVLRGTLNVESIDGRPFRILSFNGGAVDYVGFDPSKDVPLAKYELKWNLAGYDAATCKDAQGNEMPQYLPIETDHPDCAVFDLPVRHPCTRAARTAEGDAWMIKDQRVVVGKIESGRSAEVDIIVKWLPRETSRIDMVRGAQSEIEGVAAELVSVQPIEDGARCRVRITPEEGYRGLIRGKIALQSENQLKRLTVIGTVR